jgi:AraC-like DNA-binding protein
VAKAIGYHPYYLGAVFKSNLGITLGEYINRVRFERAEELLTYTDDAVYSIAEACGFRTPEHFSKKFKSRFGISPNKWRKKRRQI